MNTLAKIIIGASITSTAILGTVTSADAAPHVPRACSAQKIGEVTDSALLTAGIASVDHEHRSATATGTGEPGATIRITGPAGEVTTIVDTDGTWSLDISGLAEGANLLPVTQDINGVICAAINLTVIINPLETSIVHPHLATVAGAIAIALPVGSILRRRKPVSHR